MSPVSSISIACLFGTARDSATMGVEQKRPIFTPGVAKRASSAAIAEIAGGDKLAAGGGSDAMHLGDHRLGQGHDGLHQLAAAMEDRVIDLALGLAAQFLQIMAGAEPGAGGGKDHHLH